MTVRIEFWGSGVPHLEALDPKGFVVEVRHALAAVSRVVIGLAKWAFRTRCADNRGKLPDWAPATAPFAHDASPRALKANGHLAWQDSHRRRQTWVGTP